MRKISILMAFLCANLLFASSQAGLPAENAVGGLYPVGFSRDGKFAYVYWSHNIPFAEFNSSYSANVVNLKTDEKLEAFTYFDPGTEMDPQAAYNANRAKITALFSKYAIERSDCELENFPAAYLGGTFEAKIEMTRHGEDEFSYPAYKLVVTKLGGGSKVVHESDGEGGSLSDAQVEGYFLSPYEGRIAVVVQERHIAGDAASYTLERVFGCSLTRGF